MCMCVLGVHTLSQKTSMQSFRRESKVNRFSKFFHCRISKKILYIPLQKFPPHLKSVTTLFCEIWMLKISTELALIIQSVVNQTG